MNDFQYLIAIAAFWAIFFQLDAIRCHLKEIKEKMKNGKVCD